MPLASIGVSSLILIERQRDLLIGDLSLPATGPRSFQKESLLLEVGLDHLGIIEGEGDRIEDFRCAELGKAFQDRLDSNPIAIEGKDPSDRYPGLSDVRTPSENTRIDTNVRMRDEDQWKHERTFLLPRPNRHRNFLADGVWISPSSAGVVPRSHRMR